MKQSKLRIMVALTGLAALATQAGGPPRDTAPIVQLPPSVQPATIPTPMAGPNVSLAPPHEDFYATQARARPAAPVVTTQARTDVPAPAYRGGEPGPVVELQPR